MAPPILCFNILIKLRQSPNKHVKSKLSNIFVWTFDTLLESFGHKRVKFEPKIQIKFFLGPNPNQI